jgi:hypothetical protein
MIKRLFVYVVIMTWIFTMMDWAPIHQSYLKYNNWPDQSVYEWWPRWSAIKDITGKVLCPPCKMLAEPYYFAFFEVEAGIDEQTDLYRKHAPYLGILGNGFYWGQGGEDNSNAWKFVSWEAWFLYWLPYIVIWWTIWGDLFYLRKPWWLMGFDSTNLEALFHIYFHKSFSYYPPSAGRYLIWDCKCTKCGASFRVRRPNTPQWVSPIKRDKSKPKTWN